MIMGSLGRLALLLLLSALAWCGRAGAEPVRSLNAESELHFSHKSAAPGEAVSGVLRLSLKPGWHSYWRNPGDSGEPTEIRGWRTPAGVTAGPLQWPPPAAIAVGTADYPITSVGYEGEVLFPFALTIGPDVVRGPAPISADVRWLECADVCIPVEVTLTAQIDIGGSVLDPVWSTRIGDAIAGLPRAGQAEARLSRTASGWRLTVAAPGWTGKLRAPRFFPYERDVVKLDPAPAATSPGQVQLDLTPLEEGAAVPERLHGVLSIERAANGGPWVREALEIEAERGEPLFAAQARTGSELPLWQAFVFAFLGGLLLNVMPCVFPVLSVKALTFATAPAAEVRRHGVLYLVGVLVTFLALAGVLIGLQSAGAAVGWGFQLQEPRVVAGLALLFFALGLNLSGVFELGSNLQSVGGGLAARGGDVGAFFTGALAVVAASPCTAAFMGAALGFAATQPPLINLAVFASLGLGFAAPFTALAFAPGARRLLPQPGAWMVRFKEVLAFPMFATMVFLLWVLSQQVEADALALVLLAGLVFAFGAWAVRWGRAGALLAGAAGAALLLFFGLAGQGGVAPRPDEAAVPGSWRAWSASAVATEQAAGRPVFVDFTAAWCVTCQVNKALVLSKADVAAAFAETDTALFEADWTTRSPEIAAELARHGRVGVPLYLLYTPGRAAPEILPQQLDGERLKAKLAAAAAAAAAAEPAD